MKTYEIHHVVKGEDANVHGTLFAGQVGKGDILLFCLGSWASEGSQREFQAHGVRGRHPRETRPAARCRGSKRGSKSLRWKLVRFLA
ncbi:MAG: hypothetical protein ACLQPD_35475 [Desulfomonilaceae bacterium]